MATWRLGVSAVLASLLVASGLLTALPVRAALPTLSNGPAWIELTPAQRNALLPVQPQWVTFDTEAKRKWMEVASRFPRMSAAQRERVQQRMTEWVQMTPAQRNQARLQFQDTSKTSSDEERRARWQAYQALPSEEREALVARARERRAVQSSSAARRTEGAGRDKINIVGNPYAAVAPPRPVAPALVQGNPGVTTFLMPFLPVPPLHQQAGMPKIATAPDFVDAKTLLPLRGPQGAAALPAQTLSASK